jgi:signal peptidase I
MKYRRIAREIISTGLVLLGILAARSSLADHYVVPSGSMEPALVSGDRVVVDKRAYGLRIPFTLVRVWSGDPAARGDVVIVDEPVDGTRLIKRVAAVGGDFVEVRDGVVLVNGQELDESWRNLRSGGGPELEPMLVPPGEVLLLGDNRGNSRDGRVFGLVRERELYGKAAAIYWRSADGFTWLGL